MKRLTEEQARKLKWRVELPRTSEEQAETIASRLNCSLPQSYGARGIRYRVLNHYPSGNLYLARIRGSL